MDAKLQEKLDKETEQLGKLLRAAALQLSEHVDTVQIVATKTMSGGDITIFAQEGLGNWYARRASLCDVAEEMSGSGDFEGDEDDD